MRNEEWSSFELRLGGYVTSQALIQAVLRLGGAIPDRQDGLVSIDCTSWGTPVSYPGACPELSDSTSRALRIS